MTATISIRVEDTPDGGCKVIMEAPEQETSTAVYGTAEERQDALKLVLPLVADLMAQGTVTDVRAKHRAVEAVGAL